MSWPVKNKCESYRIQNSLDTDNNSFDNLFLIANRLSASSLNGIEMFTVLIISVTLLGFIKSTQEEFISLCGKPPLLGDQGYMLPYGPDGGLLSEGLYATER